MSINNQQTDTTIQLIQKPKPNSLKNLGIERSNSISHSISLAPESSQYSIKEIIETESSSEFIQKERKAKWVDNFNGEVQESQTARLNVSTNLSQDNRNSNGNRNRNSNIPNGNAMYASRGINPRQKSRSMSDAYTNNNNNNNGYAGTTAAMYAYDNMEEESLMNTNKLDNDNAQRPSSGIKVMEKIDTPSTNVLNQGANKKENAKAMVSIADLYMKYDIEITSNPIHEKPNKTLERLEKLSQRLTGEKSSDIPLLRNTINHHNSSREQEEVDRIYSEYDQQTIKDYVMNSAETHENQSMDDENNNNDSELLGEQRNNPKDQDQAINQVSEPSMNTQNNEDESKGQYISSKNALLTGAIPRDKIFESFKVYENKDKCSDHPNEDIQYYCFTNDQCLCVQCILKNHHANHDVKNIHKARERMNQKLDELFIDIKSKIDMLSISEKKLLEQKNEFNEAVDQSKMSIKELFKHLHDIITNKEQELLTNMNELAKEKACEFDYSYNILNDKVNSLVYLSNILQNHSETMSDACFCNYLSTKRRKMHDFIQEHHSSKFDYLLKKNDQKFMIDTQALKKIIHDINQIKIQIIQPSHLKSSPSSSPTPSLSSSPNNTNNTKAISAIGATGATSAIDPNGVNGATSITGAINTANLKKSTRQNPFEISTSLAGSSINSRFGGDFGVESKSPLNSQQNLLTMPMISASIDEDELVKFTNKSRYSGTLNTTNNTMKDSLTMTATINNTKPVGNSIMKSNQKLGNMLPFKDNILPKTTTTTNNNPNNANTIKLSEIKPKISNNSPILEKLRKGSLSNLTGLSKIRVQTPLSKENNNNNNIQVSSYLEGKYKDIFENAKQMGSENKKNIIETNQNTDNTLIVNESISKMDDSVFGNGLSKHIRRLSRNQSSLSSLMEANLENISPSHMKMLRMNQMISTIKKINEKDLITSSLDVPSLFRKNSQKSFIKSTKSYDLGLKASLVPKLTDTIRKLGERYDTIPYDKANASSGHSSLLSLLNRQKAEFYGH